MEPNFIFQRLAKLDFFVWLNKKHSYFELLEELEIYSHDLLDHDSIIRTSFNALAIRFFKEQHAITVTVAPGKYSISFKSSTSGLTRTTNNSVINEDATNAGIEKVCFASIKHVLNILEAREQKPRS